MSGDTAIGSVAISTQGTPQGCTRCDRVVGFSMAQRFRLSMRSGEGRRGRCATRLHPRSLDSLTDSSVDGCVVIVWTGLEEHVRFLVPRVREEQHQPPGLHGQQPLSRQDDAGQQPD